MDTTHSVILPVADGTELHAYVARPQESSAAAPGIILFQEAFGVNAHIRSVADRLAAAGYVAIAPELFHRTAAPGQEFSYDDFPSVMAHYQAVTVETMTHDAQAAYDWLQDQPNVRPDRIGSLGFCLGGQVSFVANAVLPLSAGVSYYGGGLHTRTALAPDLHAPHLFFWGGLDAHISPEHRQQVTAALDAAGKPYVNTVISDADHGFHCDARGSYNPAAAAEAWALTLAFLQDKLGR